MTIYTIGHSTHAFSEFADILDAHGIEAIADVRRFPGSRRLPQFESATLQAALANRGIDYVWIESLGGRRRNNPASVNTGWRNASFRAYADHLASEEFALGLDELLTVSGGLRTAIMCAEVLWWRCHRRLIADVLTVLGESVEHVRSMAAAEPHRLEPPARLVRGVLTYAVDGTVRRQ